MREQHLLDRDGRLVAARLDQELEVGTLALAAKKAGGQVRRRYQDRLADLYESELSTEVMKARDLLRRLDVVGLRLNEAADALADAAVKRSEG